MQHTKSNRRNTESLIEEMFEQIDNLQSLARQFGRGEDHVYKPMSVCLRTMLLGSSGQSGLFKVVLPDAFLGKLRLFLYGADGPGMTSPAEIVITNDAGGSLHYAAGSFMRHLGIENGGIVLTRDQPVKGDVVWRTELGPLFNVLVPMLPVEQWLDQPFLRAEWSIRSFIRTVANKDGGAHVDTNPQLKMMMDFGHIHRHLTNAIAVHVAAELGRQMSISYPFFKRQIE